MPGQLIIRNTSSALIATNPIFTLGQLINETDTLRNKIGDGVSTYAQLTYIEIGYEIVEAAGTDTYTGTFTPSYFLTYFPLQRIRVRFANANTGASTINLNGLGAKAIKKTVSVALAAGDILAGGIYELVYDGTNFQIPTAVGGAAGATPTLAQVLTSGSDGSSIAITNLGNVSNISGALGTILTNATANYWKVRTYNDSTGAANRAEIYYEQDATVLYSYNTVIKNNAVATAIESTGFTQQKNAIEISCNDIPGSTQLFPGLTYKPATSLIVGTNGTQYTLFDRRYNDLRYASISVAGSVTSVSVVTNQGVSGSVATATTTPAITLTLGALTGVTSFNGLVITANTGAITTGSWAATVIPLSFGGTNANLTASLGGVFYSTATAGAILAGTATAGQHLQSGASAAPTWTTATFPSTATGTGTILRANGTNWVATTNTYPNTTPINQILFATAANVIGGITTLLSDGTFMSLGRTALVSAADVANFEKNANSSTRLSVINTTSGTAGRALMTVALDNTYTNVVTVSANSALFTSSGLQEASTGAVVGTQSGGLNIGTFASAQLSFWTNNTKKVEISSVGNMSLGGVAVRATTVGTFAFQIFNGTAPAGTLANGVSLYSAAGVLKSIDAAGLVGFVNSSTDGSTAPATNAIGVILDYYGTSATRVLTTPNSWEIVTINGTVYKRPLYT